MSCPYCGDTGFINKTRKTRDRHGNEMDKNVSLPCLCRINPSINKKYKVLSGTPDAVPYDIKEAVRLLDFRNLLVLGPEQLFLYAMRCFIACPLYFSWRSFIILNGYEMIKDFHSAGAEEGRSLNDLLEYDLLVLTCFATANMTPMKEAVYQVIRDRIVRNKPVWIFSSSLRDFEMSQEFSSDLFEVMKRANFKSLSVEKFKFKQTVSRTAYHKALVAQKRVAQEDAGSY
jgi:hypothetical protein